MGIAKPSHFVVGLLCIVGVVSVWSWVGRYDTFTWWMETFPVWIGLVILLATYKTFRFTQMVYFVISLHMAVLLIGGHYSYARVPFFDTIRPLFHFHRNHFDRLGHFMQGFGPALIAREVLLRRSPLQRGKWMAFIVFCICLAISASYELLEWRTAVGFGDRATDFLGTQGDPWDTQWDMTFAAIGATVALLGFTGFQDRQLARFSLEGFKGEIQ